MDPVSAIGLASSLVQLVSFIGTLVSKSREIHRSADGSLVENDDLATITRTLEGQTRRIATQASSLRQSSQETALDLLQLCDGVRGLTKELIAKIGALKSDGSSSKWDSFRLALKGVWDEQDITDLVRRLERYRQQIDSILLANLQERLKAFSDTAANRNAKIEENFAKVLQSLQPGSKWQRELIETARQAVQAQTPLGTIQLSDFSASLSAGATHDRQNFQRTRMLQSLKFADMRDRYERISEAHQKTFDWVFHEHGNGEDLGGSWDNFSEWLMSNNPLYWITGKPGSGKSTLMKYLSDDERLQIHLRVWKGDNPLFMSRFFFWNSGTTLQMSRIGLLQSLLYQTLLESPGDISLAFPDRWEHQEYFGYDGRPWSWTEVSSGFRKLVADKSKCFFFLIDGLDEFDGDCSELADFLLGTASKESNVKLCLASRPWLVFEDAFRKRPSLRMEDLTSIDIRLFTSDQLAANPMFAQLQENDSDNSLVLIEEVVKKSSGVFLWVRLVVKSLLEGLQDGDTMDDLSARLFLIPRDLGDLFRKILSDLDTAYFEQASLIFQTVRASHVPWRDISLESANVVDSKEVKTSNQNRDNWSPLALFTLSFVGEDPARALSAEYGEPMSWKQQCYHSERMRRRLNSRCKGLLEAPQYEKSGPNTKVQYLHRTVKDFLEEDGVRDLLASGSKSTFNAHLALCAALIRHTKAISPKEDDEDNEGMEIFSELIRQFIVQSHWLERRGQPEYVLFLDEMNKVTEAILDPGDLGIQVDPNLPHWTKRVDPHVGRSCQVYSLFDYAVIRSLTHYVRAKLMAGYIFPSNPNRGYLTAYAIEKGNQEMINLLEASDDMVYLPSQPSQVHRQGLTAEILATSDNPGHEMNLNRPVTPVKDSIGTKTGFRHKVKTSWIGRPFNRK
ncbi:hypothetical protein EDB80DRAFT_719049 [Ilyonectria destructans]|nr:hypothetical protein EDB80DRAFT_719049 [Ilyonectria destructans]